MNNRGKRLINLVLNQNNESLNSADKESSNITHRRKNIDKVLNPNDEKLNNADKENQLSSMCLDRDAFSLIVINGNNCHIENIENFDQLQNNTTDKNNLIQSECLLSKTIEYDTSEVLNSLDTLNSPYMETNALAANDYELSACPWTVAIDDSTVTVAGTNQLITNQSTNTLTNCTTVSSAYSAATTEFTTNATNISSAINHYYSIESTFTETTADINALRAENEPHLIQNLFYRISSPADTVNAPNVEANASKATDNELTSEPWTIAIDNPTENVVVINSSTISNSCSTFATPTAGAPTTTSSNVTNVLLSTQCNNSTQSIFLETSATDTQRAENALNQEQMNAFSDPNNHNMNEGRKRRKTADPKNWKRNLNKKLRMEGKNYTGFRTDDSKKIHQDTPREERKIKPICTKEKCLRSKTKNCSKFTQTQQTAIFNKFWSLNWDERKAFVCGHVTKIEKQKCTVTGHDSRRNFTLKYRLSTGTNEENVEVCREMFINTLGVGYRMIQLWVKKSSFEMPDPSTSRSLNRTSSRNAKVDHLQEFFKLLPKMPSHYGRQNSSKLFLEPIFRTTQEVYQLYLKKCNNEGLDPLSRRKFSEVMGSENISLFQLKKDQCNTCKSYEAKNITEQSWEEHVRKKELARKHKQQDKDKALSGSQITIEVDFQAVKLAPFTNANAFYYKTKLACHNYSIYNLQNKQATCYWFSEDQNNQLVASTFVSCLIDYLEKYCITPEKNDIIIYSDGCTAQNRNNIMSNALLNFSILHGVNIYQKYLEVGHTQMEVDSVHGCIERKLKGREIKLPSDYVNVTREARKNPCPYEAFDLEYNFFKNYTQPLRYKSIRPGKNKNDPTVMDIKVISYSPDGLIKIKLDFDGDYVMLPNRPVRHAAPVQMYPPLYTERCKITKSKWLHLQELKSVIPSDCHQFYDNLPYNE